MVKDNTPPAPDGSDSSRNTLDELYPSSDPERSLTMPKNIVTAVETLESMKDTAKKLDAEIKSQENIIKAFLGDAETAVGTDWAVTWKTSKRTGIDSARLKRERPDIFEHYQKTTESRTFRTKRRTAE
jgi:predicted phage-related endonuclease